MIFDEKRLGYGVENPLIKKGAFGYFSNDYKAIQGMVDIDYTIPCELKDVDLSLPFPYENKLGWPYKLFYVVKEAPSFQPLTDHELMELLGEKLFRKYGDIYVVKKFEKTPNEAGELLLIRCRLNGFVWVTADELLEGYTFKNGEPIGKEIANEDN